MKDVQAQTKSIAIIGTALLAAAILAPGNAFATKVINIGGTYSHAQIKKDCDAAGGVYDDNGSRGCLCIGDKATISCNGRGKCTGTIDSSRRKPPHTIGGILRSPAGKSGIGKVGGIKLTPAPRGYHLPAHVGGQFAPGGGKSKAEAMYGRSTGPTNPNGPDIPGKGQGSFASFHQHHR